MANVGAPNGGGWTNGPQPNGAAVGPARGAQGAGGNLLIDQFGNWLPPTNDPAFQPPGNPLRDIEAAKGRAKVIHREIPNVVVETGWSPGSIRSALMDLVVGVFDRPSQLHESIMADSRVQSAMKSRSGGLLGRAIRFKVPKRFKDDQRAIDCHGSWERHWPAMHAEPALLQLLETAHSLGFSYSQILWDTSKRVWKPYLVPFNARYCYYHWTLRTHVAVTLDGQMPITGGDAHWVLHAPYGSYRGWMFGALRAIAQWYLARNYALRDWARYCERHGFPIPLADTPFGADPQDILAYQLQLANLGQESVMQLPGSVDVNKYGKYDLRYLEPKDDNWQAFKALIEQCNDEITLSLLAQNLTTQVKEGSFAAARVHADVRQALLEADARALAKTLYVQVARPFAALNFGDANLAPEITWDVRPPEDLKTKAETFESLCVAIAQMRMAGIRLTDVERFARRFGIIGMQVEDINPLQVEAKLAQATGKVEAGGDAEPVADDEKKKSKKSDKQNEGEEGKGEEAVASRSEQRRVERRRTARMVTKATRRAARSVIAPALEVVEAQTRETAERLAAFGAQLAELAAKEPPPPPPAPEPPREPELTFAQRNAAFLADLKEMRDLGLKTDRLAIEALAEQHGVPAPESEDD
jgi:phage gp29-like protein